MLPVWSPRFFGFARHLFRSRTISKRCFAFGGAWLTVVAGLQSTGLLCRLVDCGCDATAWHVAAEEQGGCSHDHAGHSHQHGQHPSNEHGDSKSRTSQPCEHDCWCCQPPAPQQQPAALDVDGLTQPAAGGTALAMFSIEATATSPLASSDPRAPERAVDACARLCRFLA
jgi:hypothetical protein